MRLIDLSHAITDALPVYPGDDETRLEQTRYLDRHQYTGYRLATGMHAGTHVDVPMHLLGVDGYVADLPLERCIGTGVLLDARGERLIGMRPEYVAIPENSIVLVCTGHSAQFGTAEYFENHPLVDPALAEHLIGKKIKMLGIDLPSADLPPFPVHRMLFSHGIPILENLTNLEALLGVNRFEVIALPLKINAEGSPLRVVARVK